jgi:hypothetical protein
MIDNFKFSGEEGDFLLNATIDFWRTGSFLGATFESSVRQGCCFLTTF